MSILPFLTQVISQYSGPNRLLQGAERVINSGSWVQFYLSLKKTCTLEEFSVRGWAPATGQSQPLSPFQTVPHCLYLLVSVMSPSSTCPAPLLPSSLRTTLRLLRLSSCSTHPIRARELNCCSLLPMRDASHGQHPRGGFSQPGAGGASIPRAPQDLAG